MIDAKIFFDRVRASLFGGHLNQSQVDSLMAMIKEYERRMWTDIRWLAACMGTARIETGPAMQPVRENLNYSAKGLANTFPTKCAVNPKAKIKIPNAKAKELAGKPAAVKQKLIANYVYGGRNGNILQDDGWNFRGGGFPQTTGRANYKKIEIAAKASGHCWELLKHPELLLEIEPAVFALFEGMEKGLYTTHKLSDYFTTNKSDWRGSRDIINPKNKTGEYAGFCLKFYDALK